MDVELSDNRGRFGNSVEFLLTCISYGAGCAVFHLYDLIDYLHGGWIAAAVLGVFSVLVAVPMIHLELSIGQISGLGPSGSFAKMAPLFRGVGWAFGLICVAALPYQLLETCRAIVYLVASLRLTLSWTECGHSWNTIDCIDAVAYADCRELYGAQARMHNGSCLDTTLGLGSLEAILGGDDAELHHTDAVHRLATREFYRYYVHKLPSLTADSVTADNPYFAFTDLLNWPQWQLSIATFVICFGCLFSLLLKPNLYGKGSAYKLFVLSLLVVVFLLVALPTFGGLTWDTMWMGMKEWLYHQANATRQDAVKRIDWRSYESLYGLFFTYGTGFGAYITLASFHRSSRTKIWPVLTIAPMLIVVVSLLVGFAWGVLRATLTQHLAQLTDIPYNQINAFGDFRANYIIIPAALASLELGPLFSGLYFLAYTWFLSARLLPVVWTVVVVVMDEFPGLYRHHCLVKVLLILALFCSGVFMCTPVGPQLTYFIYIFLSVSNIFCVVFIALLVVLFAYGWYNLQKDLALVLGLAEGMTCCKWWWGPISPLNTAAWFIVLPAVALLFSVWDFKLDMKFAEGLAKDMFSDAGYWVGWGLTEVATLLIILIAFFQFIYGKCRKEALLKPTVDWAPSRLKQYLYVAKAPLGNERTCWCCCGYQTALYAVVGLEVVAFFLFLFYALTNLKKETSAFQTLEECPLFGEYARYVFVGLLALGCVVFLVTVALVLVAARRHSPRLLMPYLFFNTLVNAGVFVYAYELFHHLFGEPIVEEAKTDREKERQYYAGGYAAGCLLFWLYRCFMLALVVGGHYLFRSEQPPAPTKDGETAVLLLSDSGAGFHQHSAGGGDPFTAQEAAQQFHISQSDIPLVDQNNM